MKVESKKYWAAVAALKPRIAEILGSPEAARLSDPAVAINFDVRPPGVGVVERINLVAILGLVGAAELGPGYGGQPPRGHILVTVTLRKVITPYFIPDPRAARRGDRGGSRGSEI
jgi:hypothetical protein